MAFNGETFVFLCSGYQSQNLNLDLSANKSKCEFRFIGQYIGYRL